MAPTAVREVQKVKRVSRSGRISPAPRVASSSAKFIESIEKPSSVAKKLTCVTSTARQAVAGAPPARDGGSPDAACCYSSSPSSPR
ncbi:hypothetical protein BaRGS_00030389, partial [Batillaria attramentaria]